MILCNALIRILSKKNIKKKINLFCRSKHHNLIKYMYRDNKKINLIGFDTTSFKSNLDLIKFIENYLKKKLIKKKDFITIGFDNYEKTKNLNLDKLNKDIYLGRILQTI